MTYNVLNYGDAAACQGPVSNYHQYLKTIVGFANPDVIGLVKMGAVKRTPNDPYGNAPYGFGDSILRFALNAAYPARYSYCRITNTAGSDDISMLFFDTTKLGYLATVINYTDITDFNVYKLYYKDALLSQTGDTTFLYVILNHTQSGDGNAAVRGSQIDGYMQEVRSRFSHLPNMICMGDFNIRNTYEPCYQSLVMPADTAFRFYDPTFYPDAQLSYPADWDNNAAQFSKYLTTSTRQGSTPNNCGTGGGGKSWYDHLLISPWLAGSSNYIKYIPASYRTIGNDAHRTGIAINNNSTFTNTAAPAVVITALWQMSNKYPVMADFLVTPNSTGTSPADPDLTSVGVGALLRNELVAVTNPVRNDVELHWPESFAGKHFALICYDLMGRIQQHSEGIVLPGNAAMPCQLNTGSYMMVLFLDGQPVLRKLIIKL